MVSSAVFGSALVQGPPREVRDRTPVSLRQSSRGLRIDRDSTIPFLF